jgi:hypothetical protein
MPILKNKAMYKKQNDPELILEMQIHVWEWCHRQMAKKVEVVNKINTLSISSIKQKLK